jgi:predicted enzyme related to lactoylglutathione lyase
VPFVDLIMKVTGLDFIWLEVNNIINSIEFYRDQLGLPIDDSDLESSPPMATVRAGKLKIILAEEYKPMITRGRGVNFFLNVSDVDLFYGELISRGLRIEPPVDEGWGGRFITVKDPDGYRLFFFTWTTANEWPSFINI